MDKFRECILACRFDCAEDDGGGGGEVFPLALSWSELFQAVMSLFTEENDERNVGLPTSLDMLGDLV